MRRLLLAGAVVAALVAAVALWRVDVPQRRLTAHFTEAVGVFVGTPASTTPEATLAAYSSTSRMSAERSSAVLLVSVRCVTRNWFGLWLAALAVNCTTTK